MKKLLGLLAVAPMALAACGEAEAKVYAEVAGTAYGSTHGGKDMEDAANADLTDVATGITKAKVELDTDGTLKTLTIDETGKDGTDYVWNEEYDATEMDSYGFRILSAQEAGEAMADYKHTLTWKYGTDYMPVCTDPGAESECGDDDQTSGIDESTDDVVEAQGWTKTMDGIIALFEGMTLEAAKTQHSAFLGGTNDADWTTIVGASAGLKHVHHYTAVVVEAFETATDAAA